MTLFNRVLIALTGMIGFVLLAAFDISRRLGYYSVSDALEPYFGFSMRGFLVSLFVYSFFGVALFLHLLDLLRGRDSGRQRDRMFPSNRTHADTFRLESADEADILDWSL